MIYFILKIIKSIPHIAICLFKSLPQIFRTCYSLTFKRIKPPDTYHQKVFNAPLILRNNVCSRSSGVCMLRERERERERERDSQYIDSQVDKLTYMYLDYQIL